MILDLSVGQYLCIKQLKTSDLAICITGSAEQKLYIVYNLNIYKSPISCDTNSEKFNSDHNFYVLYIFAFMICCNEYSIADVCQVWTSVVSFYTFLHLFFCQQVVQNVWQASSL